LGSKNIVPLVSLNLLVCIPLIMTALLSLPSDASRNYGSFEASFRSYQFLVLPN